MIVIVYVSCLAEVRYEGDVFRQLAFIIACSECDGLVVIVYDVIETVRVYEVAVDVFRIEVEYRAALAVRIFKEAYPSK